MIESWVDILLGMMFGICATVLVLIFFFMIRMNLKFAIWRKVRDHEEDFHAEELKEREKQ